MCGIVGVASNGPMLPVMKDFFQSLLFHDVVRGHHATGVAAIDTQKQLLTVEKKAVASPQFLEIAEVQENLFAYKHDFNIYIGHNRWATSGAKDDDKNAHPFVHGDVVGVHNGSLRNQRLLDNHKDYVVDSDNLYHHLNANGLTDTLAKTDGAFALVWYDREDSTLNFIRNSERPLCIAKLTNGCWVWASERSMLMWLVKRHKSLAFAQEDSLEDPTVKVKMIYDLEAGLHMAIPYNTATRTMANRLTLRKMVLPTFTWTAADNHNYYTDRSYSTRGGYRTQQAQGRSPFQKERDEVISKHLPGGLSDSYLEVKYLRPYHPATSTGYIQNISLYEHRNIRGETIIVSAYNHTGNMTMDWNEEEHGGTVLYCKILGLSMDQTKNEQSNLSLKGNAQISVNEISRNKPKAPYFGYTEVGDENKIDTSAASVETKGGDTSSVIPFPPSGDTKISVVKTPKVGDQILANCKVDTGLLVRYLSQNTHRCANCGTPLRDLPLRTLYLIEHEDLEQGQTNPYLNCSISCHESMAEWIEEVDAEYNRILGVTNDTP